MTSRPLPSLTSQSSAVERSRRYYADAARRAKARPTEIEADLLALETAAETLRRLSGFRMTFDELSEAVAVWHAVKASGGQR